MCSRECIGLASFQESIITHIMIPERSTRSLQQSAGFPAWSSQPLFNWRGALANYMVSYLSKLNWILCGCCQKTKQNKEKKNLRPREDCNVYKSKEAGPICNASAKKKRKKP